jgi:hypothetical protein
MSNHQEQLQQLKARLQDLRKDLETLESLVSVDVPSSLNKIRFVTEKVLYKLCVTKGTSWGQGEPSLERMIGPLLAGNHIPKSVGIHIRTIQTNTSPGSHYQESSLSPSHVRIAQDALIEFLWWYLSWAQGPIEVLAEQDEGMPAKTAIAGALRGAVEVMPAEVPSAEEVVPVRDSKVGKKRLGQESNVRMLVEWAVPASHEETRYQKAQYRQAQPPEGVWENLGTTTAPGIALVAVSVAGILINSLMLLGRSMSESAKTPDDVDSVMVVLVMGALLCSMIVCVGGVCMLQRKLYWFVVASACLAMFGLFIASIFGLPVGVWALTVLLSKPVRDSFH